ncbi:unnamed protein product [Somion occarium]|uniref:Protein kinase domain-containing protein n=1 Tax=Somion occarium TaxID=3059160 RepID=A0ABP1DEC3_9APHY
MTAIKGGPAAQLAGDEHWWKDHYEWLNQQGYQLRPRYRPGWRPSWLGIDRLGVEYEDGQFIVRGAVLDATRASDGDVVVLKRINRLDHPYEEELTRYLSSGSLASDPRNHCIKLLDVLHPPDELNIVIFVLPLLLPFYIPYFVTFGEAVDFIQQVLEFLHDNLIAHRDCMFMNIMLDPKPLYPNLFHPTDPARSRDWKGSSKHYSRTTHPVRYVIIDFGISRRYRPEDLPPCEPPIISADKSVPENQKGEPCNPFPTDVYLIGNLLREWFLQVYSCLQIYVDFGFIKPLVDDMVQNDPEKRPSMDVVVSHFEEITKSLSGWKLRSRLKMRSEWGVVRFFMSVAHVVRTATYILRRLDPIPACSKC